jgi:tripartite-type tricarboxylate transporter receptor subunit TctC
MIWENAMKPTHRRQFLHLAAGAVALPIVSRAARAQAFPTRPGRILVGFPAGSAADTIVRIMAQWLSDRLGQSFVVENRAGAATNLALQAALASPPDGYSLVYISTSTAISTTLYESQSINFLRDSSAVAGLVRFPHVMAAHPSLPAKTVAELIALAKSNPGKVNVASYGTGSTSHLAAELFKSMTGVNLTHVPYRGDAQAMPDLLSGRVQIYIATLTTTLPYIQSGTLRALAVTGKTRFDRLPDVPTVDETLAGYDVEPVAGLGVRKGTPSEIIAKLNTEINAGLANPAIKARLAELAAIPLLLGATEFGSHMAAETEKWAKVIRAANVKPE